MFNGHVRRGQPDSKVREPNLPREVIGCGIGNESHEKDFIPIKTVGHAVSVDFAKVVKDGAR